MPLKIDGITVHESITEDRVVGLVLQYEQNLDNPGLCIKCGEEAYGVEPDARAYTCEHCEEPGVYGAEEILMHVVI